MRKARQPGSTLEFSDYRLYQYGDDIRQIDWNVYGRTGKYYIKRFLDEKEITVAIYLDCSQSMQVYPEKWQLAKQLAAGFSFIALVHNDRLSFIPVKEDSQIATRKGPAYARAMFRDISELSGTIDGEPFTSKCKKTLLKNCDLAIVISDGLEPIENWGEFFKRFAGAHKAVRFLQILARKELEPDFTGDISLIDIETEQEVNVTITEKLTAMYRERLLMHNKNFPGYAENMVVLICLWTQKITWKRFCCKNVCNTVGSNSCSKEVGRWEYCTLGLFPSSRLSRHLFSYIFSVSNLHVKRFLPVFSGGK